MQKVKYSTTKLLQFFLNHPKTAYKPSEVAKRFFWNPGTVRKEIKRLKDSGYLKRNPDSSYIIAVKPDSNGFSSVAKSVAEVRGTTRLSKSPIQIKSHEIAIENINLSGYIEFMQKFNMLKPVGLDNAQNVGLRSGIAKKFAMRVCLKNPRKSSVYPISKGWQDELRYVFNDDPQILDRIYDKDTKERVAVAIDYSSLQENYPQFKDTPFEDLKGMTVIGPDGYIKFCESQFKDGEVCIHGDSKKDTENILYELLEGTLERAHTLKMIDENVARMPFVIVQIMGGQVAKGIQDAMEQGIEKGMEKAMKKYEYKPSHDEGKDVQ